QSYTGMRVILSSGEVELRPRPPEAYGVVEARPELYVRLQALAKQTRLFLSSLSALPKEVSDALDEQEQVLERLTTITVRQLEGAGLTKDDEQYIKGIGGRLLGISAKLTQALTPPAPAPEPRDPALAPYMTVQKTTEGLSEALLVPLVADVHTDLNTERVLEEGTGPLEWMLAITRLPDGTLSVAAGPVFSFKEFVHPLNDRLSNEKWRLEHRDGAVVPDPRWWSEDRPVSNGFELPTITP
ncbi:MAG TPA: DUF3160 domain-containing protein, partial [Polyangiaceae bacterium]|nr:DUF3160 domain-containing protein [Polyangiaceae bacterium]